MAKEYNVGDRYYLPVTVKEIDKDYKYSVAVEYVDCEGRDTTDTVCIADEPDLLLTAEDIAMVINTERDDALAELKSRNAELEALLKEVTATRDEAIRQNNELIADRNNWKEAAQRYHDNAKVADAAADELRKENRELKAKVTELNVENDKLTADLTLQKNLAQEWHDKAHQTAQRMDTLRTDISDLRAELDEAKEANNGLTAKVSDLRNRVGEQLAQIQDLNAEVHFLKESGKQKPTEEATKHAHVVLNDGTELAFTQKATHAFYRDDVDMLFISDGDGVIAGFNRGDKPTNFAYFF